MKTHASRPLLAPNLALAAVMALAAGCGDRGSGHGHDHSRSDGHGHDHEDHAPPHGGTPVIVAEDKFHLELVRDPASGRMQAYVLDGHLEKYVTVMETNFLLLARTGGKEERLELQRRPEGGTGTLAAKTALFEGQADWVKAAKEFEGRIPSITLDGQSFSNIAFSFPKGSKHVH